MHHPIQMKPADSENRNGKNHFQKFWGFFHLTNWGKFNRKETLCGDVVEEDQRERRAHHVQSVRIHWGVHRPPRQQQHQPRSLIPLYLIFFLSVFFCRQHHLVVVFFITNFYVCPPPHVRMCFCDVHVASVRRHCHQDDASLTNDGGV